ncbi:PAS domain S-box-containing protein [Marinobacterium mangrovicola]|uniref:histidine kinase n=2 Tax=Marinobacterium mangrovicola TaxID=1476959 RepID=A0A4R1GNR6_9GAMM|nr:PAS domain S-box-containing protein [Marinobacterium mangrovicola]
MKKLYNTNASQNADRGSAASSEENLSVDGLIGLGGHSARKSYYPALQQKVVELEAERNRYKWLFENAFHGIFQADTRGWIQSANAAMARICATETSASLEGGVYFAALLQGGEEEFQQIRNRLLSEGQLFLYETRIKRLDGSQIDVSMNLLLRPHEEGEIIEGFVADITRRMEMQNRVLADNEALEQRVQARTAELTDLNTRLIAEMAEREEAQREMARARDAAESANLSKDKYLAAASHDLLQPLNAARLLVSALRERELPSYEGDLVDRVHLALSGAEHLLSDLLDISKLDQNAVQPDIQAFSVQHLLFNLEAEFQPIAQEAGVSLKFRAPDLAVQSDMRLLSRVLRNLIGNAIRYTDSGGVLVALRKRANTLRIEVWDTGQGIPEDKRQDIFKEFQQLGRRPGRSGGVGLGLAIVDRIARVLDLSIQLVSVEGRGSRFSFSVPLSDQAIPLRSFDTPLRRESGLEGVEVLVIDNEPEVLVSMKALLDGWGCEVVTAASAEQAIAENRLAPELILADYHLDDDATGTEAVAALRDYFKQAIPAAILTADRSSEVRKQLRELELPLLNKPIKPSKLRALIQHLSGQHQVA